MLEDMDGQEFFLVLFWFCCFLITYDTPGVAEKLVGWTRINMSNEARDFENNYLFITHDTLANGWLDEQNHIR